MLVAAPGNVWVGKISKVNAGEAVDTPEFDPEVILVTPIIKPLSPL